MSKKITLDNAITINGKAYKELTYNIEGITAQQYLDACSLAASKGQKGLSIGVRENDYKLHFYLGIMAIIVVNPEIDVAELEKVTGFDILHISNIGRFFTFMKSEETSPENTSEEQPELTPDTTAQA